ncbi:MAG: FecR domain-containing protein [Alistipes sp.]
MNEELLYRYFRGATTSEENNQIWEWLASDPEKNKKEMRDVRYILSALDNGICSSIPVPMHSHGLVRRIVRYSVGVAALVALLIGANFLGQHKIYSDISSRSVVMQVPVGQRMQITLEDGSKVWLNAGTRLEYPAVFGKGKRCVRLFGEAMFEVQHEHTRPFIVETFASDVEVLGTKFNVMADEVAGQFSTALLEGSVKVVGKNNGGTLFMQPNDVVSLVNGRLVKKKIDDPVEFLWTEGIISIKGMTFAELMSKFEKTYGVKIEIESKVMPKLDIRSGKIRMADGIDHALRVLQLTADFEYSRNEERNSIVIY